jgi:hypothetical protein
MTEGGRRVGSGAAGFAVVARWESPRGYYGEEGGLKYKRRNGRRRRCLIVGQVHELVSQAQRSPDGGLGLKLPDCAS